MSRVDRTEPGSENGPPDPPLVPDLDRLLVDVLQQIPAGRVASYGTIAEALGTLKAARWVAEALNDPHDDVRHVCHRVVRRTGELGGYFTGRPDEKRRRLVAEGVPIDGERVDLDACEFRDFDCDRPLAKLLHWQHELADRVRLEPYRGSPKTVGGLDVSYLPGGRAVGAYVLVEVSTGRLLWSKSLEVPVRFPYITGLLAFREIPVHRAVLAEVRRADRLVPVVFVDGNGILHPRRAGVACQLGVLEDLRTIGIGKKLLCGRVDFGSVTAEAPQPVLDATDSEFVVGSAVVATDDSRPFFASPGHRLDVRAATRLARAGLAGHRLPEPIHLADRVSREAARR